MKFTCGIDMATGKDHTVKTTEPHEDGERMFPLGSVWVDHYDAKSKKQGWCLFNADGTLHIQKLDEPEEGDTQLLYDDDAICLVAEQALKGCKMSALALWLDGQNTDADEIYVPCTLWPGDEP